MVIEIKKEFWNKRDIEVTSSASLFISGVAVLKNEVPVISIFLVYRGFHKRESPKGDKERFSKGDIKVTDYSH